MAVKSDVHVFTGMQRDLDVAKHKAEFLYDAHNIRFTAIDGDTLFCITNEKSTKQLTPKNNTSIQGSYLGHCVVGDVVVLFSKTQEEDIIYKIIIDPENEDNYIATILYHGNLNFNTDNPIETLGVYENENIQKVYWVDGLNQPRVIRIDDNANIIDGDNTQFDFVATLNLNEEIYVERIEGSGMFAPGTIQYAFTYYNKYGRESNIFYTTSLNYISFPDRGGSPEDKVANEFNITISNIQSGFDFLRVYSIHRTSIDAIPTCKRVIDIDLRNISNSEITVNDNGQIGDIIDSTMLLYIGGESIIPTTLTQKDNTLFLGNYKYNREDVTSSMLNWHTSNSSDPFVDYLKEYSIPKYDTSDSFYSYINALGSIVKPGFKVNEHYRLGIQFQHKSGKWSSPIFIGDHIISNNMEPYYGRGSETTIIKSPNIKFNAYNFLNTSSENTTFYSILKNKGYKKVRGVCVFPSISDRLILTQGMLCPTVYSISSRKNSAPFAQSSWFLRPNIPKTGTGYSYSEDGETINYNIDLQTVPINGSYVQFKHLNTLYNINDYITSKGNGAEIQGSEISGADDKKFYVDQSIVTMHSPEIEFDTSFDSLNYTNWKLNVIGAIRFTANGSDIDIQTSSPVFKNGSGFKKEIFNTNTGWNAGASLISAPLWNDNILTYNASASNILDRYGTKNSGTLYNFMIYPWQRSGSLNNDENRKNGTARSAVLSKKKISNLKYSLYNTFFKNKSLQYDITPIQLFASEQMELMKTPFADPNYSLGNVTYYGNVDTLLYGPETPIYAEDNGTISSITGGTDNVIEDIASPVRMKYKSGRHLIFSLKVNNARNPVILPKAQDGWRYDGIHDPNYPTDSNTLFWVEFTTNPYEVTYLPIKDHLYGLADSNPIDNFIGSSDTITGGDLFLVDDDYGNTIVYIITGIRYNSRFPATITQINYHTVNTQGKYYKLGTGSTTEYYKGVEDDLAKSGKVEIYDPSTSIDGSYYTTKQDTINVVINQPYLLLGELFREEKESDFGGKSDDALKSNLWLPAGEPILLDEAYGSNNYTRRDIEYTQGDTWYQRYDCLKTYPFTMEDENSITEIGSFMCETRVNIDGRYDRNRGQVSNITVSPNNFNLLNEVYSQKNNFFNYRVLDEDYYNLNKFSNTVTWTKEKTNASIVDLWTNITAAETFDLDGTKGKINALRTFNDNIYCFQDDAISRLLFNSRVQINASDGIPIEIANSKKMEGKVYISDIIGCTNKWTIAVTPAGIYFIDSNSKEFYNIGQQLVTVSGTHGFSDWFKGIDVNKYRTFYDYNDKDLYILDTPGNDIDNSLVFSENLGQFTSFMNYGKADAMFNINNGYFAFSNSNMYRVRGNNSYNIFFGEVYPFDLTFISNADASEDKIFTNLEMRADFYVDSNLDHRKNFDYIQVYNEYQNTNKVNLTFNYKVASNLKKKFRIWRMDIPRDYGNMNRIRNTWTTVKLGMNNTKDLSKTYMKLHDLVVQYYI